MDKSYIAFGVFIMFVIFKRFWMIKSYTFDSDSKEKKKSAAIKKAYREIFLMLGFAVLAIWLLEKEFNF